MSHLTTTDNYDAIKTRGPVEAEFETPCCGFRLESYNEDFDRCCSGCWMPYTENAYGDVVLMTIDEVGERMGKGVYEARSKRRLAI